MKLVSAIFALALTAPVPLLAQTVSSASGTVGARALAGNTGSNPDVSATDSWASSPAPLSVTATAVATGPVGGTVTTKVDSSAGWAANGLTGTISLDAGWDFEAADGEGPVSASFGNGNPPSWSYAFTLNQGATLNFIYFVVGQDNVFGLQGWEFSINGIETNLVDNYVFAPSAGGALKYMLTANTPYLLKLNTNGNINSTNLSGYRGSQHGEFLFGIASTAVPEPATWTMMLAGFGVVGFGLRSRRKASVCVTYA